jgi:hypothetical protein
METNKSVSAFGLGQRRTSRPTNVHFIPSLPFDVEVDVPPHSCRPKPVALALSTPIPVAPNLSPQTCRLSSQHAHSLLANSCSPSYFLVRRLFVTVDHYYVLQFRRTHNGHTQF